jgi:hypothetical protein
MGKKKKGFDIDAFHKALEEHEDKMFELDQGSRTNKDYDNMSAEEYMDFMRQTSSKKKPGMKVQVANKKFMV